MSEKSEKDRKAFQSYLENIKAKTGKTPANLADDSPLDILKHLFYPIQR